MRELESGDPHYGDLEGILVAEVARGSPAWRNGLRPGDLVFAINRRRVRTLEELRNVLGRSAGALALNLLRGTSRLLIVIRG